MVEGALAGSWEAFDDRIRMLLQDQLRKAYAADPSRYGAAVAKARGVLRAMHNEVMPGIAEEGSPEDILALGALTKIFFVFTHHERPDDTPTKAQLAALCVDAYGMATEGDRTFQDSLDVLATHLYFHGQDAFIGSWGNETSGAERLDAALDRLFPNSVAP